MLLLLVAESPDTAAGVEPEAVRIVRAYLVAGQEDSEPASADISSLLTCLCVLCPDGRPFQAGALVLTPSPRPLLALFRRDVAGRRRASTVPVRPSSRCWPQ